MKKLNSFLIILTILLCVFHSIPSFAEDSSFPSFDTALTSVFANSTSAKSFLSTSSNRAFLTICLYMDLAATTLDSLNEKVDYLFSNASYVGITDDDGLAVLFYDDDYIYTIWYSPLLPNEGFYTMIDRSGLIDSSVELGIKLATKEYYKNSLIDLVDATNKIVKLIQQ
ncbi:MAG: hypothetical protein IJ153_01515 [Clostridia bacterium]|nr:hypothetical protein [Clostridia bacterium]